MSDSIFPSLEERNELRSFLYHIKEIVKSQGRILALSQEIDGCFETDSENAAEKLSYLQVEIFDHLQYHIRELETPFAEVLERLYGIDRNQKHRRHHS